MPSAGEKNLKQKQERVHFQLGVEAQKESVAQNGNGLDLVVQHLPAGPAQHLPGRPLALRSGLSLTR